MFTPELAAIEGDDGGKKAGVDFNTPIAAGTPEV
jgi:hypothetical protein